MENRDKSIVISEILQEHPQIGEYFKGGKIVEIKEVNTSSNFREPLEIVIQKKCKRKSYYVIVISKQAHSFGKL